MTFVFDPSTDFVAVVDDFVSLRLVPPPDLVGFAIADTSGGEVLAADSSGGLPLADIVGDYYEYGNAPSLGTTITHAVRQSVSTKEAAESFGRYQLGDVHFSWPISEGTPQLGGVLVDSANAEWTILDVNYESLMALYRVTARDLAITVGLNELVTINRLATSKDSEGAVVKTPVLYLTDVRARLQEESSERGPQFGRQSGTVNAKCYLAQQLLLDNSFQIVRADGKIYEVVGYESPDSIGSLTTINCMRRQ
jgi:hypothetical protein